MVAIIMIIIRGILLIVVMTLVVVIVRISLELASPGTLPALGTRLCPSHWLAAFLTSVGVLDTTPGECIFNQRLPIMVY